MKKDQPSHSQDHCEIGSFGGVEKSGEHLLDITGLSEESNCSTILVQDTEGGAIMAEKIKQAEGEEELLRRDAVHTLMSTKDQILNYLPELTTQEQAVILDSIKYLLFEQVSDAAVQELIGR